jgi:membrane-bound lytic murein transglycosylase F
MLGLGGCGDDASSTPLELEPRVAKALFGDLDEIKARGTLRIGRQRWSDFDSLPHEGIGLEHYARLAESFATTQALAVEWFETDDFDELLASANAGFADLVIGNISITEDRLTDHRFTVPLSRSAEWLVGRPAGESFRTGIPSGTAYLATAAEQGYADVVALPSDLQPDEVLERIREGDIDRTIMDAVTARALLASFPEITMLDELPARPLAWVVRPESETLGAALDAFVSASHLSATRLTIERRNLSAIAEAGVLRVVTVTGPHTYFLYKGERVGFEYEVLQRYAASQDLLLEVIVAPDRDVAYEWLIEGRADVFAAALTNTPERRAAGWTFTRPYLTVEELVVTAVGAPTLARVEDLAGIEVVVNERSSHWTRLANLGVAAVGVADDTDTILEQVVNGKYQATVADSHLIEVTQASSDALQTHFSVADEVPLAWVVPEAHDELRASLDAFIEDEDGGLQFNLLKRKYFSNERRIRKRERHRVSGAELSPYDATLKALADEHTFDWRLLVAQTYQESAFDPGQTSFAGARGLLQVMPRTARQLGVSPDQLFEPEPGLQAGVRYLAWCRERFEAELPFSERTWFALAAYNAGPGHVRDARRLAVELGLNRDLWFGHVEQAMLALSKPEHARRAAHGYVRGREPVNYVREIRDRYQAYVDHLAASSNE